MTVAAKDGRLLSGALAVEFSVIPSDNQFQSVAPTLCKLATFINT